MYNDHENNNEFITCPKCNGKISSGSRFCNICGASLVNDDEKKEEKSDSKARKIVYEGEIRKCPKCGKVLDSLEVICSECGFELNEKKTSSSITEFSEKLQNTDGKDKVNLIKSFVIPNTKIDIIECMHLAVSNFDAKQYKANDPIARAWKKFADTCYDKAKMLFKNNPEVVNEVKEQHDKIENQIKSHKTPILTSSGVTAIVIILLIIFFVARSNKSSSEKTPVYEKEEYNSNVAFYNDYSCVYDTQSKSVYRLKLASIDKYVLSNNSYAVSYDTNEGKYIYKTNFLNSDNLGANLDNFASKNPYNAVPLSASFSKQYNLYNDYLKLKSDLFSDSYNYVSEHKENKKPDKSEYNMLLTCQISFYVYDFYDALKNLHEYYYTFTYNSEKFEISLCKDSDINFTDTNLSLVTNAYCKNALTSYNLSLVDKDEHKITDVGSKKNYNVYIDINELSEYELSLIKEYGYVNLSITLNFDMSLTYHGDQQINICNNDDFTNYLYSIKKEFTEDLKKYYNYTINYTGNIDDVLTGKLYIFYDASGSGDDDWLVKNMNVTIAFSK